jgi:hypothetical protein
MKARAPETLYYEFDFPRLDAAVAVQSHPEGVIIHASANTFSEERMRYFIRELAAEGFIDEACCWRPPGSLGGVQWIVDPSEFMPGPVPRARTRRFILGLIFSGMALGVILIGGVILGAGR